MTCQILIMTHYMCNLLGHISKNDYCNTEEILNDLSDFDNDSFIIQYPLVLISYCTRISIRTTSYTIN